MGDLALYRRSDGGFDLAFDEGVGDLLTSESLENAVIVSIGTYARERKLGSVANLSPCIGGWWGDTFDNLGTLGGYLYEAFPERLTTAVARRVETLAAEALAWLIKDGVAKSVGCVAEMVDEEKLSLRVEVERPDGNLEQALVYEIKWKATDGI